MKKSVFLIFTVVVLTLSMLSGCVYEVRTPPPPRRVDVRPAPPFTQAVWIEGHWQYRHRNWKWIPGYWKRPPRAGTVWVPGHWKQTRRGWKRIPGHWRR